MVNLLTKWKAEHVSAGADRRLGVTVGLCGCSVSIASLFPVSAMKIQPGKLPHAYNRPSIQVSKSKYQGTS